LKILKELKLPIIGVVENMKMTDSDYIEDNVSKMGLTHLNSIYFDNDLEDSIGDLNKLLESDFMKDFDKIVTKAISI
jgi:hypothetical protein